MGIDLEVSFAGAEDGKLWGDVTVVETEVHENGDVSNRVTVLNNAELTYVGNNRTTLYSKGRDTTHVQEAGYDGETVHKLLTSSGEVLRTYHYEQPTSYAQEVHGRAVTQYLEDEHMEVLERLRWEHDVGARVLERLRWKHKVIVERVSALFR